MLRRIPTLAEEIPRHNDRRGPHRPAEDAVQDERAPVHTARASHQRFEHARDREEAAGEDGLAAVAREETFHPLQALRGELHVAPPLQDERPSRLVAHPVADLVADDGPEDAEDYGAPEAEVTLLDQHPRGQEYGRTREGDAHGPEHHAEEDDQVPVVLDQGVEVVHSVRSIRTATAFEELSKPMYLGVWCAVPARSGSTAMGLLSLPPTSPSIQSPIAGYCLAIAICRQHPSNSCMMADTVGYSRTARLHPPAHFP